jgi:thiamine kinase-like enzyme
VTEVLDRVRSLPCWTGTVDPQPLSGGITHPNFVVEDGGKRYVVRIGGDIKEHQMMRFNELAASRAAEAAGISPALHYVEESATVLAFIEGRTLTPEDVRSRAMLERVLPLVRQCHHDMLKHFRGPVLAFWVFHALRDYAHTLTERGSRMAAAVPDLLNRADTLEQAVGSVGIVFGHNDLLAANLIDDGDRLWLIDWDYAGLNSPLFDLGGLASNNELSSADEDWLLEHYFETPIDDDLRHRYAAMKCASLLRESMWSMVSEIFSTLDFDYRAYTDENLARFESAWSDFNNS